MASLKGFWKPDLNTVEALKRGGAKGWQSPSERGTRKRLPAKPSKTLNPTYKAGKKKRNKKRGKYGKAEADAYYQMTKHMRSIKNEDV